MFCVAPVSGTPLVVFIFLIQLLMGSLTQSMRLLKLECSP